MPASEPALPLPPRSALRLAAVVGGVVALLGVGWVGAHREPGGRLLEAPESSARPNFLMIDIDTLAFDHVGAIREGQPVTPVIDALGARGVRFTRAMSQSGWTLPALSSVLTGALPVPSEVEDGAVPWRPRGARDLPEILQLYGYNTAVFWGRTLPGPLSNAMSQSFGFVSMPRGPLMTPPTVEEVDWLAQGPAEPVFLYVQQIDLHQPWP